MVEDARVCRICLEGPEVDADLIEPCGCRGSMRWVHRSCLAVWWQSRLAGGAYDHPTAGVQCDICQQTLAQQTLRSDSRLRRVVGAIRCCCFECCITPWQDVRQDFLERLEDMKRHKFLAVLTLLMLWWAVSVTSRPHGAIPPGCVLVLQLGHWALPVALWCGTLTWAVAPMLRQRQPPVQWIPRRFILSQDQCNRLLASLAVVMLLAPVPVSLHGTTPWRSALSVLSPALPMACLSVETRNLLRCWFYVWPCEEQLLNVETHLPWLAATFALNTSYVVNYSGWLCATWMAVQLAPLANRERLIQQQEADDKMFAALEAAAGLSAVLHVPLILRSVLAASNVELTWENAQQTERWSRIGAMVLATALTCLAWFSCRGPSWSMSVVLAWSALLLVLARRLGASSCQTLLRFGASLSESVRSSIYLTMWRQSLRAGDITFTSREQAASEPLLHAEGRV